MDEAAALEELSAATMALTEATIRWDRALKNYNEAKAQEDTDGR